ncbi:MAG: peptide MFS transporter [Chlamydiia bacterium]|nr:peptide MFS transporter [Chlamydiia bacterium]
MKGQPKAVYLLNFVSMWERFSFHGLRGLLVLYMTQALGFGDRSAFVIYAAFVAISKLGGIAGGFLADKYLGLKKTLEIGVWILLSGHIVLYFAENETLFFAALGLIVMGTALFISNIAALVGLLYPKGDARIESGYTLYYTGINVGSFFSAVLCGVMVHLYGWHAGFGVASFGMLSGAIALKYCGRMLPESPRNRGSFQLLGGIPWKQAAKYMGLIMLFYGCEEQLGSTIVLFTERFVDRQTFIGQIPTASLGAINPLTIMIGGPFVTAFLARVPISESTKIKGSFLLLSLSFMTLAISSFFPEKEIPVAFVMMAIMLIGMSELLFGPAIFSGISRLSPEGRAGSAMGLVPFGFFLANFFAGAYSQTMVAEQESLLLVYRTGFFVMALGTLAVVGVYSVLRKNTDRKAPAGVKGV